MPPAPSPATMSEMKPSVYLSFPREKVPDDFGDLSVGDDVVVLMRGKVRSLSENEEDCSVSVEYSRLELVGDAKPKTMQDALNAIRGR